MALMLDPDQESRVREAVARKGDETAEDFVARAVEQALLERLELGPGVEGTPEFWQELKIDVLSGRERG